MSEEEKDAPLSASGDMHENVHTAPFDARLESVDFVHSIRVKKTYGTDTATTNDIFVVAKVSATASRKPLQLQAAYLLTADGLKYKQTEKVSDTATLSHKWVQYGWRSTGSYFFEIPASALPDARLIVAEDDFSIHGDQWRPEVSLNLGLDAAKAKQMTDSAKDVLEVTG